MPRREDDFSSAPGNLNSAKLKMMDPGSISSLHYVEEIYGYKLTKEDNILIRSLENIPMTDISL